MIVLNMRYMFEPTENTLSHVNFCSRACAMFFKRSFSNFSLEIVLHVLRCHHMLERQVNDGRVFKSILRFLSYLTMKVCCRFELNEQGETTLSINVHTLF